MRDDDITELIVNALTGRCLKCKGRGYIHSRPLVSGCFGGFGTSISESVDLCATCDGTGEV